MTIHAYVDPGATGSGTGVDWTNAYTALNVAENQEVSDHGDLVTEAQELVIHCRDTSTTPAGDTADVIATGWTTSAAYYLKVVGEDVHNGVWDDSIYYQNPATGAAFQATIDNVRYVNMQAEGTLDTYNYHLVRFQDNGNVADQEFSNCILRQSSSSGSYTAFAADSDGGDNTCRVFNNIIYGCLNGIRSNSNFGDFILYHNTCYGTGPTLGTGIDSGYSTGGVAKNNISYNYGNNYNRTFKAASDFNFSDRTSDDTGGTNDDTSGDIDFVSLTSGSEDFHLAASADAFDGEDLSSDADGYLNVALDIDGDTRTGWHIGADEFISTGATGAWPEETDYAATFAAIVTAAASITEGVTLADTESATAAANAAFTAGLDAGDSDGGAAAAIAALTNNTDLTDTESALAAAVAALNAGLDAGESWAADAAAIASLTAATNLGDSYLAETVGAQAGTWSENTDYSEAFDAAVTALASLTEGVSLDELVAATAAANASISASASLGSVFSAVALSALSGALVAGTSNASAFVAAVSSLASLTEGLDLDDTVVATAAASASIAAGISFGASFNYAGTVGCLIATITIAAALSASTKIDTAVDGGPNIDTAVDGNLTICP